MSQKHWDPLAELLKWPSHDAFLVVNELKVIQQTAVDV